MADGGKGWPKVAAFSGHCLSCIFRKQKLIGKLPRASSIWDLHFILRIISRGVPGLATDLSCDVSSRDESLIWWRGIFSIDFLPLFMFYTLLKFYLSFPIKLIYSQMAYLYYVFCTDILHRRNIYSVLLRGSVEGIAHVSPCLHFFNSCLYA